MRTLKGVVGRVAGGVMAGAVLTIPLLLTGCVAVGPQAGGYGYGGGYTYSPVYPAYVAPAATIIVPVVRAPRYRPYGYRHWHG